MSKTDTRQRIIDTATNLFSCHGLCATSIDDILKGVGITKGAFYHYFKGKDHLCEIILERAIAEYHQLADTLLAGETDSDLLHRWCQMLIEKQTSGQWLYYRLLMRLSIESSQLNGTMQNKLRTFWLWCQTFYETLITKSCRANGIELSVEPQQLARLFIAARFGSAWLDRCAPAPQDLVTVCETLLKLSLR
jgi:AcrR family transcriptional regulator